MSKTDMLNRYRLPILIGVAALLVWLNVGSPGEPGLVRETPRAAGSAPSSLHAPDPALQAARPAALPGGLSRAMLDPALRDPFEPMRAPVAPVVAYVAPLAPVVDVATAPPPPPPLGLAFSGRMTAPDGTRLIYVSYGDTPLTIAVGQTLPNGYRVEAITAQAVELSYPPQNTTARLDLPAPPPYEIR